MTARFAADLFGRLTVSEDATATAQHHRPMPPDECLDAACSLNKEALEQLCIDLGAGRGAADHAFDLVDQSAERR